MITFLHIAIHWSLLSSLQVYWKLEDREIVCYQSIPVKLPLAPCLAVFGHLHSIYFFVFFRYPLPQGHLQYHSSLFSITVFSFHRLEIGEKQVDSRVVPHMRLLPFWLEDCISVFSFPYATFGLYLSLPSLWIATPGFELLRVLRNGSVSINMHGNHSFWLDHERWL